MSEEQDEPRRETWGQRHGVTVLTTVVFALLGLVMLIQVAC